MIDNINPDVLATLYFIFFVGGLSFLLSFIEWLGFKIGFIRENHFTQRQIYEKDLDNILRKEGFIKDHTKLAILTTILIFLLAFYCMINF